MKISTKALSRLRERRIRLWLGFGLLLLGCYLFTLSQQDGVREAVVRDEIARWRIGADDARPPAAVFVSFDNRDPGDGFLRRFRHDSPIVYKASQGVSKTPLDIYRRYWVNPATGLKGSLIHIGNIVWMGPFLAHVEVSYPTYGSTSTVVRVPSGWKVIYRQQTWMH